MIYDQVKKKCKRRMIPDGWKTYKLGEIAEIIGGGTPSTAINEYWNGSIPWLTPRDLTNYNFKYINKGERSITESGLRNSSTRLLPEGTVLLTSRAPIGYLAIGEKPICTNQGFKSFITDDTKVNNQFLYYLLKSNIEYIKSLGTGTTFAEVSGSALKVIEFEIPESISEQSRIVSILSSLDDKIELNLQTNKTLESIAQSIFKEWFVDFRYPRFDGVLVDGLPKGWKKVPLPDMIDSVSITHKFPNDQIIFLNTSDILNGEVLNHKPTNVNELPGQAKKSIKKDDILFSEIRPANRRFAYIDFNSENYVVSTKLMVLRSKGQVDPLIVYFFLKRDDTLNELQKLAESRSGTFPQITFGELNKFEIIIPNEELLKQYTSFLRSIFLKIKGNQKENQILIQLRDTLLPKLISGKIRVA
jgi:type I restriction enzyme S subunit